MTAGLVLFAAVVLPSLGMAFGATSMAAGALLVSGLCIFMFIASSAFHPPTEKMGRLLYVFIVALAIVFIHGALSFFVNAAFDFTRFWQTYVFLIIYVLGASALGLLAQRQSNAQIDGAAKFVFAALILSGLIGAAGFSPFIDEGEHAKPMLFFMEPSHLALDLLPLLLYMTIISGPRAKLFLIVVGLVMALLLQNLTLLIGTILVALLTVSIRWLFLLAPVFLTLIVITAVNLDYYSERLNLSSDSQNLSTLAFLQGWERAYLNVRDSFGLGVGFQQFGIVGARGSIQDEMEMLGLPDLNLFDGSTVASKFIAEFGVLAVLVLLMYLVNFAKRAKWLRRAGLNGVGPNSNRARILFLSCYVMFIIDLFIRGTGYFSSTGFLLLASLVGLTQTNRYLASHDLGQRLRPANRAGPGN